MSFERCQIVRCHQTLAIVAALSFTAPVLAGGTDRAPSRDSASAAARPTTDDVELNPKPRPPTALNFPVVRAAEPVTAPGTATASDARPKLTLPYLTRLAVENHPLLQRDLA